MRVRTIILLFLVSQLFSNQQCTATKTRSARRPFSQSSSGRSSRPVSRSMSKKVSDGRALFLANGCMDCHSINGHGCTEGVSLSSVGLRRNSEFLKQQLANPEEHVEKNKRAFNFETNLMTNPNLTKKETDAIVAYLQTLRKPVPKKGQKSKYYNTL